MHYKGTLASDGTKFDSSYDRKKPFEFVIGRGDVIKGWDEGVMEMSLGEKVGYDISFLGTKRSLFLNTTSLCRGNEQATLHISSDYGYGSRGAGGVIPPNADLDFEVELLKIGNAGGECCILL